MAIWQSGWKESAACCWLYLPSSDKKNYLEILVGRTNNTLKDDDPVGWLLAVLFGVER
jgi:hypothetical protein